jgi:hypothetical protein
MGYDLRAMDREIKLMEESVKKLKALSQGIETVEKNSDAIMAFIFLLKKNISDIIE